MALTATILLSSTVAAYSMMHDPHDVAGNLPKSSVAPTQFGWQPWKDGEWHQYGRTPYGQRFSPLAQSRRRNAGTLREAWRYKPAT